MQKFIIDKVSWHTNAQGNPESIDHIRARFVAVVRFLQENNLVKRQLILSDDEIGDGFAIESSDLTERGLELMKRVYDKWLRKVDKGLPPSDISMLTKELEKIGR